MQNENGLTEKQKRRFLLELITRMRTNPNSGATVIYKFPDAGATGTLPPWNGVPHPEETITKLVLGPLNLPGKICTEVQIQLHEEMPGSWLILYRMDHLADGSAGEWVRTDNATYTQVVAEADDYIRSYGNYIGYQIIHTSLFGGLALSDTRD